LCEEMSSLADIIAGVDEESACCVKCHNHLK